MKRSNLAILVLLSVILLSLSYQALAASISPTSASIIRNDDVPDLYRFLQPVWKTGSGLVVNGDAEEAAQSAVESLDSLMKSSESTVSVKRIQTDKLGFRHIRLSQRYKGLPVVGGELIVHINRKGIVYLINGRYMPGITLSTEPSIGADAALKVGLDAENGKKLLRVGKHPALAIYGERLVYHFIISHGGAEPGRWHYYVDAHTGTVIQRYNDIKHAPPTGVGSHQQVSGARLAGEGGTVVAMTGWEEDFGNFFVYNFDEAWGVYDESAIDWEQRATSFWDASDPAAISLGYNLSATQNWVSATLGMNSFDDLGGFARGNIHHGANYLNAYWDPDTRAFYFGDGDGLTAAPLSVLDVVAHEYGHAVTEYSSNLMYMHESGALNESYSDIFGAAVEFAMQADGTIPYPSTVFGLADWMIGEDVYAYSVPGAFRDMRDPQRLGQPSYYKGTNWYAGNADNGGVHYNSGVQNFAFYLLAEGGSGVNEGGDAYDIVGLGLPAATEIALWANRYYLTFLDEYHDSRKAWVQAATDLAYSVDTVKDVWEAVGVYAIFVPTDYPTIQEAIDNAEEGDTIIVLDGTYTGDGNRNISFLGKAITVRSKNGPSACIIDCEDAGRGFVFMGGESADSVLQGFTIINGYVSGDGAGIYCSGSSPTITDCVVTECFAYAPPAPDSDFVALDPGDGGNGGGIYLQNSSATINRCVISGNWSVSDGGGIFCTSSNPFVKNSTIIGNVSVDEDGAGIELNTSCTAIIMNCTIANNTCNERGGGVDAINGSSATIINSIMWDNAATAGNEIGIAGWDLPSTVTVQNSNVSGGQAGVHIDPPEWCEDCELYWQGGNIAAFPSFVGGGDYHLTASSPCIDAGTSAGAPEDDIDDDLRPCGAGHDMGSDEYVGGCSESISPSGFVHGPEGGSGSIAVTAEGCCEWTATASVDWIEVIEGDGGAGDGTVIYEVAANPTVDPLQQGRVGFITVGNSTFTVRQLGVLCSYGIEPLSQQASPTGDTGSISVIAQELCEWTAVSNVPWINITSGATSSGYGRITYEIAPNFSGYSRSGTITVESETFIVMQTSTCFLTQIYLSSPPNESGQATTPTFTWLSDACPGDIFAVDLSIPPWVPFWSTYNNLGLQITDHYWTMPENMWNRVPSGAIVFWRVRGRNGYQIPPAIIYSSEIWWFQKP